MIKEQPGISDYLDGHGVEHGDIAVVEPLSGRKYNLPLLRKSYDFISKDISNIKKCSWVKELGGQEYESFHVQIYQEQSLGRQNSAKNRYRVKVIKGAPVKLNGILVLDAFLENRDCLEIGFNRIKFDRKIEQKNDCDQMNFVKNNQQMIKSKMMILLEGETGVGKSSLARKIHDNSYQRGPFIAINISSYAESLIESELFGHVRGAFTGAIKDKDGAFREAHRGTLFIDEVDSLPLDIQTKLLLFLDNLKGRAVGASFDYQVDLRIIFSSGRQLKNLVQQGLMRKDFYYRVTAGHTFRLKSLRDESRLIASYCEKFARDEFVRIPPKLLEFYTTLPWPGNYRQLKSHLERKKILSKAGRLDFDETDECLLEQSSELYEISEHQNEFTLEEIKNAYVKKVFYQCDKNFMAAAIKLKISSRSIRNVINKDLRTDQI